MPDRAASTCPRTGTCGGALACSSVLRCVPGIGEGMSRKVESATPEESNSARSTRLPPAAQFAVRSGWTSAAGNRAVAGLLTTAGATAVQRAPLIGPPAPAPADAGTQKVGKVVSWGVRLRPGREGRGLERTMGPGTNKVFKGDTATVTVKFDQDVQEG